MSDLTPNFTLGVERLVALLVLLAAVLGLAIGALLARPETGVWYENLVPAAPIQQAKISLPTGNLPETPGRRERTEGIR